MPARKETATEEDGRDREIERLRSELGRAQAALDEVARVASHDLQEPVGVIQGYLRLFEERYGATLDPAALELVETAHESARRTQSMIRDLLTWSRLRRSPLDVEPFELALACAQALGELQEQIDASGAEIRFGRLAPVDADRARIAELLRLLVDNALQFRGDAAPIVEISAEAGPDATTVSVRDNGIGIDPRFTERVFGIFQRLHPRDRHQGNGIGLAIARTIVEKHRGTIWIESIPGSGTTVRFRLPSAGSTRT